MKAVVCKACGSAADPFERAADASNAIAQRKAIGKVAPTP